MYLEVLGVVHVLAVFADLLESVVGLDKLFLLLQTSKQDFGQFLTYCLFETRIMLFIKPF